MQNTRIFPPILILSLIVSVALPIFSQADRTGFFSGAGGFFIAVPQPPSERKPVSVTLGTFFLEGESISWRDAAGNSTFAEHFYVERDKPNLTVAEKTAILREYKKSMLEQFKKMNLATTEHPFTFERTAGSEIRGIGPAKFVVRTFFVENRLYSISSVRATTGFDEQLSLLGTFRLLSKAERIDAIIAENSPKPFEPARKAQVWESDLIDEQLTGKVRRVVAEYQESPRSARVPWSDSHFDADGNLVFQVSYINGFPDSVSTMGWLDGARVSRINTISYPMGEGPNVKEITVIMEAPQTAGSEPEGEPDDRFDLRYERTHGTDRRVETEKVMNNLGVITMLKSFTYGPSRKVIVHRSGDGSFTNKTIQVFGSGGTISEERSCDEKEKDCDVTVYKYEFDSKGNWIVQREFAKKIVRGKTVLTPKNGVLYRKIEYLPE